MYGLRLYLSPQGNLRFHLIWIYSVYLTVLEQCMGFMCIIAGFARLPDGNLINYLRLWWLLLSLLNCVCVYIYNLDCFGFEKVIGEKYVWVKMHKSLRGEAWKHVNVHREFSCRSLEHKLIMGMFKNWLKISIHISYAKAIHQKRTQTFPMENKTQFSKYFNRINWLYL